VVALNKCDINANKQQIKQALLTHGLAIEEMGGDVLAIEISAKTGQGLDKLKEAILLTAEMMNLRARTHGNAQAFVVESQLDTAGIVANVIVHRVTLKVGDLFVCGSQFAKVRALVDNKGTSLISAGPSMPVSVYGLESLDHLEEKLLVVQDEKQARLLISNRKLKEIYDKAVEEIDRIAVESAGKEKELGPRAKKRLWRARNRTLGYIVPHIHEKLVDTKADQTLIGIVKADVCGSLDAFLRYCNMLSNEEVQLRVARSGLGTINEDDVQYAHSISAIIFAFNTDINSSAQILARQLQVEVRIQNIIYRLMDDVKELLSRKLPTLTEVIVEGVADVVQVYELSGKKGMKLSCGGCRIRSGKIQKKSKYRVIRNKNVIFEGEVLSLKHFKEEVNEIEGNEFGIVLRDFYGFQIGDQIQSINSKEVNRIFDDSLARLGSPDAASATATSTSL